MDVMNTVKTLFLVIWLAWQINIVINENCSISWAYGSVVPIAAPAIRLAVWVIFAWENLGIVWRRWIFLVIAAMCFVFGWWLLWVKMLWLIYYAICIEVLLLWGTQLLLGVGIPSIVDENLLIRLIKVIWVWVVFHDNWFFLFWMLANSFVMYRFGLQHTWRRTCSLLLLHVAVDGRMIGR